MPPSTGYEQHGEWTTLPEEATFLDQLATETDATVTVIGASRVNAHPLRRIDIGTGPENTFIVTALQHGDEIAGREAALIFARDLAYTTDPVVLDYLSTHRVVILPTMQPDGLPNSRSAGGVDINRTHVSLEVPESRAINETMMDVRPQILIDLHEYVYPDPSPGDPQFLSRASTFRGIAPTLRATGEDLRVSIDALLAGNGWTTDLYTSSSTTSLVAVSAIYHTVGVLSETLRSLPLTQRVTMATQLLWHVLGRHHNETPRYAAASERSRRYARTTRDPYVLPLGTAPTPNITIDPVGYHFEGAPTRQMTAFGVEMVDGYVSMSQDARPVIPLLVDPDSYYARFRPGVRVERPPAQTGQPIGYRVQVDGQVQDVTAIRYRRDGVTHDIPM